MKISIKLIVGIFFLSACSNNEGEKLLQAGNTEYDKGNKAQAMSYFDKSCDKQSAHGCYAKGALEVEFGNKAEAIKYYKLSCDAGLVPGCAQLGFLEWQHGNETTGKDLLKQSCDKNNEWSCDKLAAIEFKAGNMTDAKTLFKKACNAGLKESCDTINIMLKARSNALDLIKDSVKNNQRGGIETGVEALKKISGENDDDYIKYKKLLEQNTKTLVAATNDKINDAINLSYYEYKKKSELGMQTGQLYSVYGRFYRGTSGAYFICEDNNYTRQHDCKVSEASEIQADLLSEEMKSNLYDLHKAYLCFYTKIANGKLYLERFSLGQCSAN